MAQKILLLILLKVTFLNVSYSWDTTAAKFYPLAVGNKWSYHKITFNDMYCMNSISQVDYIIEILSLNVLSNGKSYYLFSNGTYQRIDSNTMNVYKYQNGSECLIDSLLANIMDYFNTCRYTTQTTQGKCVDTLTLNYAGQPRKTKYFTVYGSILQNYKLMYGIGLLSYNYCNFGGITEFLNGCIINGVHYGNLIGMEINTSHILTEFSLSQNYPNPFNPSTIIKYDIAERGKVQLIVYDLLGNEIIKLVDENMLQGSYEAEFLGGDLASGIYFYNLYANGNLVDSKKMVLLR